MGSTEGFVERLKGTRGDDGAEDEDAEVIALIDGLAGEENQSGQNKKRTEREKEKKCKRVTRQSFGVRFALAQRDRVRIRKQIHRSTAGNRRRCPERRRVSRNDDVISCHDDDTCVWWRFCREKLQLLAVPECDSVLHTTDL